MTLTRAKNILVKLDLYACKALWKEQTRRSPPDSQRAEHTRDQGQLQQPGGVKWLRMICKCGVPEKKCLTSVLINHFNRRGVTISGGTRRNWWKLRVIQTGKSVSNSERNEVLWLKFWKCSPTQGNATVWTVKRKDRIKNFTNIYKFDNILANLLNNVSRGRGDEQIV